MSHHLSDRGYEINLREYRTVGWFGLLFLAALFLAQIHGRGMHRKEIATSAVLDILMGSAMIYLIVGARRYNVDEDGITHECMSGTYHVRWADITGIEHNAGQINLCTLSARVAVVPTGRWAGPQAPKAIKLIQEKIEQTGLPIQYNPMTTCKMSKGFKSRQQTGTSKC